MMTVKQNDLIKSVSKYGAVTVFCVVFWLTGIYPIITRYLSQQDRLVPAVEKLVETQTQMLTNNQQIVESQRQTAVGCEKMQAFHYDVMQQHNDQAKLSQQQLEEIRKNGSALITCMQQNQQQLDCQAISNSAMQTLLKRIESFQ